jgi:hypothetical protein
MLIRGRIRFWASILDLQLKNDNQLDFTKAYYDILDSEAEYGKTIALKVASTIFRKYTRLKNYNVTVDKKMIANKRYPGHAIWKMKIHNI